MSTWCLHPVHLHVNNTGKTYIINGDKLATEMRHPGEKGVVVDVVRNRKKRAPQDIQGPGPDVTYTDGYILVRGQNTTAIACFCLYQDGVEELDRRVNEGLPGLIRNSLPPPVPEPEQFKGRLHLSMIYRISAQGHESTVCIALRGSLLRRGVVYSGSGGRLCRPRRSCAPPCWFRRLYTPQKGRKR